MKVPKRKVASIILKWKKFGTTRTLPRAGRPSTRSNRGRRALVREVTKNPMVTLAELQRSCVEMGNFRKDNHYCNIPLIWALWQMDASPVKPLSCERHMKAHLEFVKKHQKDSDCEKQDYLV